MTGDQECDVVVVGAGVHGSSAAMYLAQAGVNTLLLDQFPVPHNRGSSHGHSRIIRRANFGTPALGPLLGHSYAQWRQIEDQAKVSLMWEAPLLVVGDRSRTALVQKMEKSVKDAGSKAQWLTPALLKDMYNVTYPNDSLSFLETTSGILMADRCVEAFQRLFSESGGRILDEWPVTSVEVGHDGSVEVRGPRGRVRARSMVSCPGPWASDFLAKIGIQIPLRVERIAVFYWQVVDGKNPLPSFVDVSDPRGHFFGVIEKEYPGLYKLVFHGGPQIHPDRRDEATTDELRRTVTEYVRERFPCLHPAPAIEESCMYTMSSDEEFVLDRHPEHKNIVFACGFSGTGFKIAPSIGENLSRLVQGKPPLHDLSAFSLERFAGRSKL